jgi:manganese/zinc/iron transport system permease protein
MIAIAALIGALSGISGALISISQERLPTGPMVILSLTVLVLFSLFFAPARGLVWDWVRHRRQRAQLRPPEFGTTLEEGTA